ncbi:hypothetical protein K2173_011928 [Erythroxylum novogranatense]|uniref:BZIP domain-containing protein n=1 Tax=Erythroxylum novogranatense TaxID=1862640 RepID=A0AAV8TG56_9ROSI|nr:hypothetical protein K2173_011928 [Erythroxylum novogranatense]
MAQLPPQVPTSNHNWPSFLHQTLPYYHPSSSCTTPTTTMENCQPSWIDEFLDFTSTKRTAHRRSISDSVAFLEATPPPPLAEECYPINIDNCTYVSNDNSLISGGLGFDKLDDEQLMSAFSDDMSLSMPPSSSNSSTPSHQNIDDEEKPTMLMEKQLQPPPPPPPPLPPPKDQQQADHKIAKTEPEEVESSCKQEPQQPSPKAANGDPITDPKRVKRILANRQSAQRSRVRKLQYISELERSVTTLQSKVSALSPRVAFLDHQRLILNVDNSALKQRIAALAQDKIFKDGKL